jgi:hypothetical protein
MAEVETIHNPDTADVVADGDEEDSVRHFLVYTPFVSHPWLI